LNLLPAAGTPIYRGLALGQLPLPIVGTVAPTETWRWKGPAVLVGIAVLLPASVRSAGAVTQLRFAASGLQAPPLYVHKRSPQDAPGYLFLAPKDGDGRHGPEIVDDRGRPVWFHPVVGVPTDFRVQSYLGNPVLTWWQGTGLGEGEPGVDYIADSSYHVTATVQAGNGLGADGHEFTLTPQGTALVTIYRPVPYDLSGLGGPANGTVFEAVVQEIDVASGRVVFEWRSLDHVSPAESYAPVPQDDVYDYFHVNAVTLDDDGNLLISGRHTWTIYKVDRRSGEIIWRLGGKHSDFALGPGVRFAWQHDPHPAGANMIRLFDNGTDGSDRVNPNSRVIWIHLDTGTMTAMLVRAIEHPEGLSATSQGNAQALANGDTFVGWGQLGRLSEFDPQGKLIFDAVVGNRNNTYRGYRFEWAGNPNTMPVATAHHARRKRTIVHAVWNGATTVARWRVLAGPRPARLKPARTIAWNGLNTVIAIRGLPREVEVVALDAGGRVIAKSKPVRAH
jgi:hypothetical protein